jgi:hypothetical protein
MHSAFPVIEASTSDLKSTLFHHVLLLFGKEPASHNLKSSSVEPASTVNYLLELTWATGNYLLVLTWATGNYLLELTWATGDLGN